MAAKRKPAKGDSPPRVARAELGAHDILRIRAETLLDDKTVRAWAKGKPVRQSTAVRISRAMNKLGIEGTA